MIKSSYKVDLRELHALCEANYARMLRLFPDYESSNARQFVLGGARIRVDVVERTRYTTVFRLQFVRGATDGAADSVVDSATTDQTINSPPSAPPSAPPLGWLGPLRIDARAYHDAGMLEVIDFVGCTPGTMPGAVPGTKPGTEPGTRPGAAAGTTTGLTSDATVDAAEGSSSEGPGHGSTRTTSGKRRLEGRYPYPNPAMLQQDEKQQQNKFLADWLSHCLHHGEAELDGVLMDGREAGSERNQKPGLKPGKEHA